MGNVGDHFQGHHTALTERGLQQAAFVADRCSRLEIDAIVSSPMVRALDTAKTISAVIGKSITESDLFAERRRPSSIVGSALSDVEAERINTEWTQSLLQGGERVLDGETFQEIAERSGRALQYLAEREEQKILVVSHGFFLCTFLAHAIFREDLTPGLFTKIFNTFDVSNTGLSIIRHGGEWNEWEVITWNDHAHLADG